MRMPLNWLLFAAFMLTACGNPLILPENANQTQTAATKGSSSPTKVVPLAIDTPVAPTKQSIITITEAPPLPPPTLYPTPASSPTPTPTFEPLSDKPIGGYVFSPPELILTTDKPIEIVQWLPDGEKLLIRSSVSNKFTLETFDPQTGDRKRLVETDNLIGDPVWLPATQQVVYLSQDKAEGRIDLFLSEANVGAQYQATASQVLSNVSPPLVPAPNGASVLVFDSQMSRLQSSEAGGKVQSLSLPEPLPTVEGGPFARYQAAWSNKTDWIAYYNPTEFMLINSKTGETRSIDLGKKDHSLIGFWVTYAIWSPDGQKLAVVVTSGSPSQTITFTQLAVFDPNIDAIKLINDDFTYVTNVTWATDNNHTLISAVIGQLNGYDVEALFLVNATTNQIAPVPIMPNGALGLSFFSSLAWSPNGDQIIVGYAEEPGKLGWYRVAVKKS